ncbi:MAG TPA: M14 metallopeptidase family protein [Pyrinomonadaceae bacterium]|nr:M14 metallopeptidase family protein [Pyrinomonadaceae bacterium]
MPATLLTIILSLSFLLAPVALTLRLAPQAAAAPDAASAVPAPRDVLGFEPGEDRKLASWAQVVSYFRRLDEASDRVRFEELGKTTMGAPFVMATITAPENFARLAEIRDIQRQLADPRTLGRDADRKAADLIARGKTVVLVTCGIHSTEVGSYLSSTLIAHRLASSNDPAIRKILRETVVLLVPSLNPDGVDIVKNWYDKTLGTPYEGTNPPELYQKYVGHDNNRDWYIFSQAETQLTVDKIHNAWRPQIVHDIHQQGPSGARIFVPPYMRPVEPNVPGRIVEGYTELGRHMAAELRRAGLKGVTYDSSYDAWTPARAYSHYHAGVRILSETASARIATPINLKLEDLRDADTGGYDPRKESANFGPVWEGGRWGLPEITKYMTTAAFALLSHAADNREAWLRRFYEIGREAVRPRKPGELFAYVIPHQQSVAANARVQHLLRTLRRGGVEFHDAARFTVEGATYPNGTAVIPVAQPYGAFAKALLEPQRYPDLRDERGNPQPPYDVTAHTLPLLMGVEARPVHTPFQYRRLSARIFNDDEPPAIRSRIGLYRSHVPAMDEGWTRFIFEQQGFDYAPLRDADVRAGNLRARFDAIVIPDQSERALIEGHRRGTMPEELTGGLGDEGVKALREFVEAGGTLVCLNESAATMAARLKLPVRDVVGELKRTEFYVPGSILRVELDTSHPVAAGMPRQSVAWVEDSPAFELTDGARARAVARYPAAGNPLLSGWLLGGEKLAGKAALVEVELGRGRVYLFGFRPQYRAQSLATYPLLFNAISTPNTPARGVTQTASPRR